MDVHDEFAAVVEASHAAMADFVNGNPEPFMRLYSQRDDVSLGNPFGPFRRGWSDCSDMMERSATVYSEGKAIAFDTVATHVTADLGCLVEIERYQAKIGNCAQPATVTLRVTTILRPEDGSWRIIHRHSDPIAHPQPPESVINE
ncbi:MAG: YybH family protein [Acidimicrobiia bacterium]